MKKTQVKTFYIVSIFPDVVKEYCDVSILKRAQDQKLIKIKYIDLRDFASDKRKTVDDSPYGGGAGMVMMLDPIYKAVSSVLKKCKGRTRIILFSAKGKTYTQKVAERFNKYYDNIILICGRYEGIDERVSKYIANEEVSIGNYVLTGGEVPAMLVVDSVSRLVPGVLGNKNSLQQESFKKENYLEHPQYTRPASFTHKTKAFSKTKTWKVPDVLLSGNHAKIDEWKKKNGSLAE